MKQIELKENFFRSKHATLFTFAACLLFTVSGCTTQQGGISVEGHVCQGFGFEFQAKITIRNTGRQAVAFDQVVAIYHPAGSTGGLRSSTKLFDPEKGWDNLGEGREQKLKAGEATRDFEFTTNGYTTHLLNDAEGRPLLLSITLFRGEEIVAGPYDAVLPSISDLPDESSGKTVELLFTP
jgi:hypothetical protein